MINAKKKNNMKLFYDTGRYIFLGLAVFFCAMYFFDNTFINYSWYCIIITVVLTGFNDMFKLRYRWYK